MISILKKYASKITPTLAIGISAVVAITTLVVFFYTTQPSRASSFTVKLAPITQEVTATGEVTASETVDLGFQRGGTIRSVSVAVGDSVVAGQILATLSSADLSAQRAQATAALAVQTAQLSSVQHGTRQEEIVSAQKAIYSSLASGYSVADNSIHNVADQFISNPNSSNPTILLLTSNTNLQQIVLGERTLIEPLLSEWQSNSTVSDDSQISNSELILRAQKAEQTLSKISTLLNNASALLNSAIPSSAVSSATIAGYQANISASRSAVSQALTNLNTAESRLVLDTAGATADTIDAQKASVAVAQAAVSLMDAQLSQTVIRAPIAGVITRQDGNAGESVAPNQSFLTLISSAKFQVNAYVSEANIAQLQTGQNATINLDAYRGEIFPATISAIAPAATQHNGSLAYKITAQFSQNDPRIKAGLTANLSINTGHADGVLTVPASAIITNNTTQSVIRIGENGAYISTPVTVGLRGNNGSIQILSGLSEGDNVAVFGSSAITTK